MYLYYLIGGAHSLYTSYPIMAYFKFFILNLEGELPSRSPVTYSLAISGKAFLYVGKSKRISRHIKKRSAMDEYSYETNFDTKNTALGTRISQARFYLLCKYFSRVAIPPLICLSLLLQSKISRT